MTALEIAQTYFDAWNRRDAAAVLATFTDTGTYNDPMTHGRIRGEALAGYMNGLWAAFPDLSFEVASAAATGPDTVAAQWIMHGTNLGSMMGLPPTGKSVTQHGADFIRVRGGKIETVDGYFDSRGVPDQLGLQVVVQPTAIGPFSFGTSVRVSTGNTAKPGAYSITALRARSAQEIATVSERSRIIATEMLGMPGFIAMMAATVGDQMVTITAWEDPKNPDQMRRGGTHAEAMKLFFGPEVASGGVTSVWIPEHIGDRWVRCDVCNKMLGYERNAGACGCGKQLPQPAPYW
jgi:steroid delta-isomerase-like uncharacterized protein